MIIKQNSYSNHLLKLTKRREKGDMKKKREPVAKKIDF